MRTLFSIISFGVSGVLKPELLSFRFKHSIKENGANIALATNSMIEMLEQNFIKIDKIKQTAARKISNKLIEPIKGNALFVEHFGQI